MSILEKLNGKNGSDVVKINQVSTPYGSGIKGEASVGGAKKECVIIQDKSTGEFKEMGDPAVCKLIRQNLDSLGSPLGGATQSEKLRTEPETSPF